MQLIPGTQTGQAMAGPCAAPPPGGPWRSARARAPLALAGMALCVLWAYWPTFVSMADRWAHDAQYSHGFLVPVFAAVVLWFRRDLMPCRLEPSWWGLPPLLLAFAMRAAGGYYNLEPLDAWSLLPALTGVTLLAAGRAAWHWAWPAVAFLGFMLPLPFQVDMALALPLRRVATVASTYVLQTLGYPAFAEGNVIVIDDLRLGVVDACSGLGMLVTFFALSTAVAMVSDRPLADRVVLVASAAPIALVANVVRITATSVAHVSWGEEAGQVIMHDLAGWLMMPLALGMLWLELKYLDRLFLEGQPAGPLPLGPALTEGPPRAAARADVPPPASPAAPPAAGGR